MYFKENVEKAVWLINKIENYIHDREKDVTDWVQYFVNAVQGQPQEKVDNTLADYIAELCYIFEDSKAEDYFLFCYKNHSLYMHWYEECKNILNERELAKWRAEQEAEEHSEQEVEWEPVSYPTEDFEEDPIFFDSDDLDWE